MKKKALIFLALLPIFVLYMSPEIVDYYSSVGNWRYNFDCVDYKAKKPELVAFLLHRGFLPERYQVSVAKDIPDIVLLWAIVSNNNNFHRTTPEEYQSFKKDYLQQKPPDKILSGMRGG